MTFRAFRPDAVRGIIRTMVEGEVVELRVHGVSGTPPEELLDCPLVEQLAGDAKAGFYKPRLWEEERDPRRIDGQPATSGPRLEGYAWGGLTSGASTRALWLLLLPFTMTNVAPRLRPAGASRAQIGTFWFVSRLLALSMTILLVTALAGVGADLFAWQCAPGPGMQSCANASPGWILHPLLELSVQHRLAVGALLPLLVIVLLWQVSGQTINNYEGVSFGAWDGPDGDDSPDATEPALTSRWMWTNEFMVRRLRHLHLQAALATVLWIVTYPFGSLAWRIVPCLLLAYVVAMLLVPAYMGRRELAWLYHVSLAAWVVLGAYTAWVAALLVWGHPVDVPAYREGLPGYAGTALAVFSAQVVLFLAFAALVAVMSVTTRRARHGTEPRTPAIMLAVLGIFLGAVFSSGLYVFAAAWLTTGSLKPGFGEVARAAVAFHVPNVVRDANRAYAVAVFALAVTAVVAAIMVAGNRVLRSLHVRPAWPTPRYQAMLVDSYGAATVAGDPRRARTIATAFWLARQVDHAYRYLVGVLAVGVVITGFFLATLIASVVDGDCSDLLVRWHQFGTIDPTQACPGTASHSGVFWDGWLSARSLQGTGAYLVVMSLVLLVGLGAAAFRVPSTRRSVGILWDLASFWPRAAHPFAAPCYAERAVPDLMTRIVFHLERPGARVVVAAHSQGTVIAAATILQLATVQGRCVTRAPVLAGVRFMSFGCVLRRLYSRYFPAYFGSDALDLLADALTGPGPDPATTTVRWRNLWRYTDYLGGPVTCDAPLDPQAPPAGAIDVALRDPAWAHPAGDTCWPKPGRHSDFWADPRFAQVVAMLAGQPPGQRAADGHHVAQNFLTKA